MAPHRLLLAAAAEEFGRVGFERTSIDAMSVAAGFAKGTVYNYFASKEELFLAVVEEAISQMVGAGSASPAATAREAFAGDAGVFLRLGGLYGVDGGRVRVADQATGLQRIPRDEFLEKWRSGEATQR